MVKKTSLFAKAAMFAVAAATLAATSLPASAATTSSLSGTGTVGANTEVDGTIKPLILSVSYPSSVSYTIDPNGNPTFTADDVSITNSTNADVDVTVASLQSEAGGSLEFTDTNPGNFSDDQWNHLTLTQSKTYLALGMGITDSTGWDAGYNTNTDWAYAGTATDFGHLSSGATGNFAFSAKHGLAFDQQYTAKHAIVFEFSLV